MMNAFAIADAVLLQAVTSISNLIKDTGFINLDFADVTSIMKGAGYAHMGVGKASGKNKAEEAAKMAVSSPLMETSIDGAHGVLVSITGSEDMTLDEVEAAAGMVERSAHPDANIIFGASFDEDLDDEIRVIVIATGFERVAQRVIAEPPAVRGGGLYSTPPEHGRSQQIERDTERVSLPPERETEEEDSFTKILEIFGSK
jgi:cell division protein FtsZ